MNCISAEENKFDRLIMSKFYRINANSKLEHSCIYRIYSM